MGLSASSLRIAMLTARKSSLEFEGQQINQQRMTLSNQSAALFNSMLTMQVPTPPDPSEFSKMVYTFNKGNGLSTLLNVSRNQAGAYTHDITYKGPKTDNVLMKKQLNNVGFKFVNGQMSAIIDGLDYSLSVNGDEEKLNEYVKTKETYDNIKNIETQMQSLWSMPEKELTSSQMKQYFETLGLSSTETPKNEKVADVQNIDDAFQNVYFNADNYTLVDVTKTYTSSTSPITFDPSKQELLKSTNGTLTMGPDNTSYTYTTKPTITDAPSLTYNISKGDDGNWSWTLNNVQSDVLNEFGITYSSETQYGQEYENGKFVEGLDDYTHDGISYSSITRNGDGTWNYATAQTLSGTYVGNFNNENPTYYEVDNNGIFTIDGKDYRYDKDNNIFTNVCKIDDSDFSYDKKRINKIKQDFCKDGANIYFKISDYNKITLSYNEENQNFSGTDSGINYNLDRNAQLTATSDNKFGLDSDLLSQISNLDEIQGYWYNYKTGQAALSKDENDEKKYVLNDNADDLLKKLDINWVFVSKSQDDEGKDFWSYTLDLSNATNSRLVDNDGNSAIQDNQINVLKYAGQEYRLDDEDNNIYSIYDGEKNTTSASSTIEKKDDEWYLYQQISFNDIFNGALVENNPSVFAYFTNEPSPPRGLTSHTYDKYTWKEKGEVQEKTVGSNESAADVNGYTVQRGSDGNFTLSGQDVPSGVNIIGANDAATIKGSINGIDFDVTDSKVAGNSRYTIKAKFKAYKNANDPSEENYTYDKNNHTVVLKTPNSVIAKMLLNNNNNKREEDDKNIKVSEMIDFYQAILDEFGLYGSTSAYKTKLDKARSDYLSTIDAKGVENPGENQVLYNFIDANGNNAYIYVPIDYVNSNGQVDSTYAYMYETSYLEDQNETISQKANIIYDENGRIAKICFDDGSVVIPEVKVEQDEEAYNQAMVKYDYEKEKYDKEISDCNAQTEIIAQQDKKLEIKLKSIDTQHSAIETELEALKKVLENNVKSSFGTFSA